MTINNKYSIGQIVWLKTDEDQREHIVTGILVRETSTLYYLSQKHEETVHHHFEITTEKNWKK